MIDPKHPHPVTQQAATLDVSRSSLYYKPGPIAQSDLALMRVIDRLHTGYPFAGSRMLRDMSRKQGYAALGRRHVSSLIKLMGIKALYRRKRTTTRNPEHRVFPYLLRGVTIDRPNQVWCADITYIPMQHGFLYLFTILDWATRRALEWRLSEKLTSDFFVDAVEAAIAKYSRPDILNTDQGSQFTDEDYVKVLRKRRH